MNLELVLDAPEKVSGSLGVRGLLLRAGVALDENATERKKRERSEELDRLFARRT